MEQVSRYGELSCNSSRSPTGCPLPALFDKMKRIKQGNMITIPAASHFGCDLRLAEGIANYNI
jgi:hypothetical protein